jgi:hypothetical protein
MWLGSVADRLIRTLEVPILLVRPAEESDAAPAAASAIAQILVPLDGSPLAPRVPRQRHGPGHPRCRVAGAGLPARPREGSQIAPEGGGRRGTFRD